MKNSVYMRDVDFLSLQIVFDGDVTKEDIDIGSIELEVDGRQYRQDIRQSFRTFDDGQTIIECLLEYDEDLLMEIFEEQCNFQLRAEDLIDKLDVATVYISADTEPEFQTLFVQVGGMTKAIELELE